MEDNNENLKSLAEGFYRFLRDSSAGGSYPSKLYSPDKVGYRVGEYCFDVIFLERYCCALDIKKETSSGIEKIVNGVLVSIPYHKSQKQSKEPLKQPQPIWDEFFEGIFVLLRERLKNCK